MPEFLRLLPPAEALSRWLTAFPDRPRPGTETLPTAESLGRVLAFAVVAPELLPSIPRATVDGYAVRAVDTFGASPGLPAYLVVVGEVHIGTTPSLHLSSGQAALIHTGAMIPDGADAVVMLEDTQMARETEVEILKPAAPGQNVIQAGEDLKPGDVAIEAGVRMRPQEIGGLMALGVTSVEVVRRPRVAILSTGDEVVPPESTPLPGQVRDVNSYTLSALVERAGGDAIRYGILPDRLEVLLKASRRAHAESDLVLLTAGSSVGGRDLTAEVIRALGPPGVIVHGVSTRPGKPTILAVCSGVPVLGLPGNPVSAMVIAGVFVTAALRRLTGEHDPLVTPTVTARLSINVASEAGREDYVPVRLRISADGLMADPVFGRSNLIYTLVRASGLIRIPPEVTGLPAGSQVEVRLL